MILEGHSPLGRSAKEHTFTLGIEEEFAIIDPETRELRSHIQEILEYGKVILKEQIKPEMHQSVVELGTEICQSIVDARAHVIELRSRLAELAGRSGLKIASVGTHPFSHWRDQLITQGERYREIVKDMQQLARANLIFGLHVHVGIPDRDVAIHVMNQARYFLPHIYALSVNSPFWVGHNTGLKGYRLKVFERFPRTGIPDAFESLSEYEDYCKEAEVETRSLLTELLEFVSTEVNELGTENEMAHIERIMREGTGADRQLGVWERAHDMKAVVDNIVTETYEGLNVSQQAAIAS